jgi:hypothetical protein
VELGVVGCACGDFEWLGVPFVCCEESEVGYVQTFSMLYNAMCGMYRYALHGAHS